MSEYVYDEENDVLRRHNRALRAVNKRLRSVIQRLRESKDAMVIALCETQTESEFALEEIRTLGGINCGPGDADTIVAESIKALQANRPDDSDDMKDCWAV